jgi:type I restriction enzyme, S subunit
MREDWAAYKFKDVATAIKGKLPKSKNEDGIGIPYLTASYLRSSKPDYWIENLEGAVMAEDGDCLILWDGAGAGDLFSAHRGVVSSTMAVVTTQNSEILREFLTLLISSKAEYIKETCRGTTVPHVSPDAIANMDLHIPPFPEQKRIVDLISLVGFYIKAIEQTLAAARLTSNAQLEKIVSDVNDDWVEVTLGDVLEISRGGSPRPIQDYITESEDGINWVKIADATRSEKYIYSTLQKIKREGISRSREVFNGDFILSNSMSFGRPYIMRTDGCIHDGWLLLSKVSKYFDEDFLYNLLNSDYVQRQFESLAAGSGVRNLNIEVVKKVKVKIPTIEVQRELASVINVFDSFTISLVNHLNSGVNLRNALLSDLLSGGHKIPASYDKVMGAA